MDINTERLSMVFWLECGSEARVFVRDQPSGSAWLYSLRVEVTLPPDVPSGVAANQLLGIIAPIVEDIRECHPTAEVKFIRAGGGLEPAA